MLGFFNNWIIIKLSHKATYSQYICKICQVVLYVIIYNMAGLVQTVKYGAINKTNTSTMGYYVIKLVPESYKVQKRTMCDGQISTAGELFVKAQYMDSIQ